MNLPPNCALHRTEDPDGFGAAWTHTEELLAMNAELTDAVLRTLIRANSKRGSRAPRPLRIPRPADLRRRRERKPATGEQMVALVKGLGGAIAKPEEVPSGRRD